MTSSNAATLTFDSNFSSLSLWNGSSGTWSTNFWYNPLNGNGGSLPSNGEQEWYINSNDPATSSVKPWTVNNGILTIQAAPASSSIQPLINNYQYTSGELNTYHSFSQTYGYFEARMELPAGQGLWPAFWMIPENGSWPPEIDTMEMLGNNPSVYYTSVHSGTSSAEVNAGQGNTVANTSTAYHDYAVSWTPTTLTYYFDGKAVYSTPTPSDMNVPMYMEMNLAVGGGWPGSPNSSTQFPANMNVAWVHAWSSNPSNNGTTNTYTANGTANQQLVGDAGNIDVFNAGTNSAIMTGGGDTNTYVFSALPTAAGQITDFDPATDTVNVGGLLQSVGYTGSNPFGDGTLTLVSDGHGGTDLDYKGKVIVDLDNIQASAISTSSDFITTGSGSTGTGGTGTGGTGTGGTGTGGTGTGGTGTGGTGTGGTGTGGTGTGGTGTGGTGTGGTGTGGTGTGGTGTGSTTLSANNTAGQILKATAPSSTFSAGQNSVVMTEDGGNNTFVYSALPYNAGQITNFNPSNDKIDVSATLKAAGYTGTSPFSDGTLTLASDGHGGTDLMYNPPGAGSNGIWSTTVVDIDNVLPSALNVANDFITGTSSSGTGTGGTGTGGTGTGGTGTGGTGTGGTGTGGTGTGGTGTGGTGTGGTGTGGTGTGGTGTGGTGTGGTGTGGTDPTLSANNTGGQILKATAPNTVFNAGQNSVVMTEDGGNNTFVYKALPYNAGQITNFNPLNDKIDVSAMLTAAGYKGTNPFGDGTLTLTSDGHSGTDLVYHPAGAGSNGIWPITVVDIDNVAASALNVANDFITGASSGGTGGTGTGGTGTGGTGGTGTGGTGTGGTGSTGTGGTSTAGVTLTANNTAHQVLTGTAGNDIFNAGQNSVVMTGDGGADTFVFNALPYNAGQITDFNPSTDKIDVHSMLSAAGYTGSNPFGDGTLTLTSDGHGGTDLMYNPPGAGSHGIWSTTVVDLDKVAPSAITTSDFITSATGMSTPSGAGTVNTGTGGTTTTSTGTSGTGSSTTATPGITLTANDTAGQVLTGTAGNDTFNAGHNSVVMTGNGGSDTFVFNSQPWNAGHITDFNPAMDTINVSGILSAAGYTGTNPLGDGTLSLSSDGNGGTNLYYHQSSSSIAIKIVDLDHVAPSSIHASDFILH